MRGPLAAMLSGPVAGAWQGVRTASAGSVISPLPLRRPSICTRIRSAPSRCTVTTSTASSPGRTVSRYADDVGSRPSS